MGEIANIELELDRAIEHFKLADQSTESQAIHDGAAFGIGRIYEARGEQTQRLQHYQSYIQRFGEKGAYRMPLLRLAMPTWRWASRTPCSSFTESISPATLRMRAWPA